MSTNPINPVAAANVLSGERAFRTVTFALTGDAETDAISGILAVLNTSSTTVSYLPSSIRILRYLAKRFEETWKQAQQAAPPHQYPWGISPADLGTLQKWASQGTTCSNP